MRVQERRLEEGICECVGSSRIKSDRVVPRMESKSTVNAYAYLSLVRSVRMSHLRSQEIRPKHVGYSAENRNAKVRSGSAPIETFGVA